MLEVLYPYALTTHISTVFVLIAVVICTDLYGLLWVTGKKETLDMRILTLLHRLVWLGLLVMITTGLTMFWPLHTYLMTNLAFFIKISFIIALIINAIFIGRHLHVASLSSFASLSFEAKRPLLISGAVSTISWVGAVTAAIMMF